MNAQDLELVFASRRRLALAQATVALTTRVLALLFRMQVVCFVVATVECVLVLLDRPVALPHAIAWLAFTFLVVWARYRMTAERRRWQAVAEGEVELLQKQERLEIDKALFDEESGLIRLRPIPGAPGLYRQVDDRGLNTEPVQVWLAAPSAESLQ